MPRIRTLAVLFFALPVFAQDLESFSGLRLRFDAPGARTTAMGGASEAVSDAFSVATNPAGLAHQTNRLFAIEGRQTTGETSYLTGGTFGSFTSSSFETTSRGLRGAVLVLPHRAANFAVYYDEPLSLSADTTALSQPSVPSFGVGVRKEQLVPLDTCITDPPSPTDCDFTAYFSAPAILPVRTDLRFRRVGAAAARSFGRVALGASVQYATLNQNADGIGGSGQEVDDARVTWNAGTQIDLTKNVRFGASYRSGAEYRSDRVLLAAPGETESRPGTFGTPASFAAGLAAGITPNLTVAVDAVHVRYSDMTRPNLLEQQLSDEVLTFRMRDVTELRAGAEYRLGTRIPVALRAGWWHEPAHRIRATGDALPGYALVLNEVLLRDQDENHVTAGVGIGERVRFDAAIDRSENTTRASVGVATTF